MPDDLVRSVVVMPSNSGLAADQFTNTFHFTKPSTVTGTNLTALSDRLRTFYQALFGYYAGYINRGTNAVSIKHYRVTSTGPGPGDDATGSPLQVDLRTFSTAASTSISLPAEVAVALTLRAPLAGILEESGGTRPRARRRGRIYLGPLNSDAVVDATYDVRPAAAFQTAVLNAAEALFDGVETDGMHWSVYSRADNLVRTLLDVQIDNACDTQRRRGSKPTTRTTRTLVP